MYTKSVIGAKSLVDLYFRIVFFFIKLNNITNSETLCYNNYKMNY